MGLIVAIVVWVVSLAMAIPFIARTWWFPEAITRHAREVDGQIILTFVITGVIFLLAQGALGYAVWRYSQKSKSAEYVEGNERWEMLWTIGAAVLFIGLTFMGYSAWAEVRFIEEQADEPSAGRVIVEVTGQQFVWNMRYPGADGEFGPTKYELIDDAMGNPLGVDRSAQTGKDDIMVPRMTVPVDREVEVILRTKDVLHNFFVPELRIKLDTVPGLVGRLRFTPEKTGTYEIVCSELCGLGHYKMRSYMDVVPPAEYEQWLEEQAQFVQQY